MPEDTSITATYYTKRVLTQVKSPLMSRDRRLEHPAICSFMAMQPPHKTRAITLYLQETGIQVLPHPVYSPYLTQCGFWLFHILKDKLAWRKFEHKQDLAKAVNSELGTIPSNEYCHFLQNWPTRLNLCIQREGEYLKNLWKFQLCSSTFWDIAQLSLLFERPM